MKRALPALTVAVAVLLGAALAIAQDQSGAPAPTLRRLSGAPPSRPDPSHAVFPTQRVPLRFSHKTHIDQGVRCPVCHAAAKTSRWSSHDLLPGEAVCRTCHEIDWDQPEQVTDPPSRCDFCHVGWRPENPRRVEVVQIPRPNIRFPHAVHVTEQNIPCVRCHGDIASQDLATRANLPQMQTCLECHNGRAAPSQCTTCHIAQRSGLIATNLPEGTLTPPRWMRGAQHDADWIFRHRAVAGNDSQFCANCHEEQFCIDCHDGRVRNRTVHPNDWLSTHPVSARRDNPRCASCHREQTFCIGCHRRTGVAMSIVGEERRARFHAPGWMEEGSNHHGLEAQRNLQACVSCHAESDCITCHGALGIGGARRSIHPASFVGAQCRSLRGRNPRPCLQCHRQDDPNFRDCE